MTAADLMAFVSFRNHCPLLPHDLKNAISCILSDFFCFFFSAVSVWRVKLVPISLSWLGAEIICSFFNGEVVKLIFKLPLEEGINKLDGIRPKVRRL